MSKKDPRGERRRLNIIFEAKKRMKHNTKWRDMYTRNLRTMKARGKTKIREYGEIREARDGLNKELKEDRARVKRLEAERW